MSYLVDTNVISELRKGARCHPGVRAWFGSVAETEIFLSVLTLGELRKGIEKLRLRDPDSAAVLTVWYEGLRTDYADRILDVDLEVAELWGRLNAADPRSAVDSLLAATALVRDLTLVTRNVEDIRPTGAKWFNPFA